MIRPGIEIWNRTDTARLSILTEDNPDPDLCSYDSEYKNNLWGHFTCTFKVKREISEYWEDLEDNNKVRVKHGPTVVWEGEIEGVERTVDEEMVFAVECLGNAAKLKNQGTDYTGPNLDPGETGSTYIVDHVVTDTDLGLNEGDIQTTDFVHVTGLEFFPGKPYEDQFKEINDYNGWRLQVWNDNLLDYKPRETAPTYYVHLADCETSALNRTRRQVINWVQVAYTPDGSVYGYTISEDTDSQDRHGKRCKYLSITGTEAEAQQIGDTVIALYRNLLPSTSLTTDIIRDQYGALVDPEECRSGKVIHVQRLLSTEETIQSAQSINESNTWEIAEVTVKDGKATFSPGSEDDGLDVILKQQEAKWAGF